jgi:GLPGLI family protein
MKYFLLIITALTCRFATAQQRVVAECTINYILQADSTNKDMDLKEELKSTSKIVYIKGNQSRVDLISNAFRQSVFFDKSLSEATILREIGDNKYISKLNKEDWLKLNQKFDDANVIKKDESKTILGFECKKAIIQLKDKSEYTVYYTLSIVPSVKEYEYQFINVPGFVLEYSTTEKGNTIIYKAVKINLNPVPTHYFDIPSSGYRLLNN